MPSLALFTLTTAAISILIARLQAGVHQLLKYTTKEDAHAAKILAHALRQERSRPRHKKGARASGSQPQDEPPKPPQAAKPTGIKNPSSPPPARRPQRAEPPSSAHKTSENASLAATTTIPPPPVVDPAAEEAQLRREFQQQREDAYLRTVFSLPSFVRERLARGLTAEQEAAQQRRRQAVAELVCKRQKRGQLAWLREVGAGLAAVLALMGEACERGGSERAFGRLAQVATGEGLRPVYGMLVGLALGRFDVCVIEWSLEGLEGSYLWLRECEAGRLGDLCPRD